MNKSESRYIKVSSPSNIAFVKYWGKYGEQKPINPSLSMTLESCVSLFYIEFVKREENIVDRFLFEEEQNDLFRDKIENFLQKYKDSFSVLKKYSLRISCSNTFPHSSGIASSASSMSALVFSLISFERKGLLNKEDFKRISNLSRLASGSSSRSIYPFLSHWGKSQELESSDDYALKFEDFSKECLKLKDAILIIDSKTKTISSSEGNRLMENHPFKEVRIQQANENFKRLCRSLREGNIKEFGQVLELEALTLHSMMMTSEPSYILLHPNSLLAIEKIKEFRRETQLDIYFTIDAGANIHVIYIEDERVKLFIEKELAVLCEDSRVIYDKIGEGPRVLEANY